MHDYKTADLDPESRAMLDYAAKLTRTPADMGKADVERLRDVGLSDE
jgi:alkylhydroperoxidase family enzyme